MLSQKNPLLNQKKTTGFEDDRKSRNSTKSAMAQLVRGQQTLPPSTLNSFSQPSQEIHDQQKRVLMPPSSHFNPEHYASFPSRPLMRPQNDNQMSQRILSHPRHSLNASFDNHYALNNSLLLDDPVMYDEYNPNLGRDRGHNPSQQSQNSHQYWARNQQSYYYNKSPALCPQEGRKNPYNNKSDCNEMVPRQSLPDIDASKSINISSWASSANLGTNTQSKDIHSSSFYEKEQLNSKSKFTSDLITEELTKDYVEEKEQETLVEAILNENKEKIKAELTSNNTIKGKQSKKVKVTRQKSKISETIVETTEMVEEKEESHNITNVVSVETRNPIVNASKINDSIQAQDLQKILGNIMTKEIKRIRSIVKGLVRDQKKSLTDCLKEKQSSITEPLLQCAPQLMETVLKLGNKFLEIAQATEETKQELFTRMSNLEQILANFEQKPQVIKASADTSNQPTGELMIQMTKDTLQQMEANISKDITKRTEKVDQIIKNSDEKKTVKKRKRTKHLVGVKRVSVRIQNLKEQASSGQTGSKIGKYFTKRKYKSRNKQSEPEKDDTKMVLEESS